MPDHYRFQKLIVVLAIGLGIASTAHADARSDLVARGEYLARAADCLPCHTAPGGQPYAGGRAFQLPFGTLFSPNITADASTGIGSWSDDDFVRAMHEGIGKGGERLYPAFPYPSYTLISRDDVLAIKAYLFSLAPQNNRARENKLNFPFNQRWALAFWDWLYNPDHRFQPDAAKSTSWNRGAYLVEALGHCGDCHTPRNILQAPKSSQKFAGAVLEGWRAYNITSDPTGGIGAWTSRELTDYLATGASRSHGAAAGPMGEVAENSLRYLTDDDIQAMTIYLRSIPPRPSALPPMAKPHLAPGLTSLPNAHDAERLASDSGMRMFAGACVGCHGWDGRGLVGTRAVNDPAALNLSQVVLAGLRLHTGGANVDMPDFGREFSDAEVALLANYVNGRFGGGGAALKPADLTKRRNGG